MCLPDSGKR
ncbi:hypothetical protein ECEC1846_3119, partial [Escherichia coli EC1846]